MDTDILSRYGSKVVPNSNGECALQCPPCLKYDTKRRLRRKTALNNAELTVRLGTCNTRRDRMVRNFSNTRLEVLFKYFKIYELKQ